MSETEETAEERRERIVAQWGDGFADLANDPRIIFDDDTIRLTLWVKVIVTGAEADTLVIREPSLDQLTELDKIVGEMAKTRRLLMQVGGMTQKEAGSLKLRDLTAAGRIMTAFTGAVRSTGG